MEEELQNILLDSVGETEDANGDLASAQGWNILLGTA